MYVTVSQFTVRNIEHARSRKLEAICRLYWLNCRRYKFTIGSSVTFAFFFPVTILGLCLPPVLFPYLSYSTGVCRVREPEQGSHLEKIVHKSSRAKITRVTRDRRGGIAHLHER